MASPCGWPPHIGCVSLPSPRLSIRPSLTSAQLNLVEQRRVWTTHKCIGRAPIIKECTYTFRGKVNPGCSATLVFDGPTSASDKVLVEHTKPDPIGACLFKNCIPARAWARKKVPKDGAAIDCWQNAAGGPVAYMLDDPAGSSRRDSIIFTICSVIAAFIVLSALCVMCGLIMKNRRESL